MTMSENLPIDASEDTRQGDSTHIAVSASWMYSGAVPHPSIAEGYEKFVPGAAERLLRMAELEQQNRFDCDRKELELLRLE